MWGHVGTSISINQSASTLCLCQRCRVLTEHKHKHKKKAYAYVGYAYMDLRTVKCLPPAESWLVNLNFPHSSRSYARKVVSIICTSIHCEHDFRKNKGVVTKYSQSYVVAWNKFVGVVMSCDLHVRNRTIDKLVFSVWIPPWSRCCLSWLYRSCLGKVSSYFCAWFSVCVFVVEHNFSFTRRLNFFVRAKSRIDSINRRICLGHFFTNCEDWNII